MHHKPQRMVWNKLVKRQLRNRLLLIGLAAIPVLCSGLWAEPVLAASKKTTASSSKASSKSIRKSKSKSTSSAKKSRPAEDKFSALVVDASTGRVLYEKNAGNIRYPASLTKMMTLYLTFDALKKGRITMDTMMQVSSKAASAPQTNIALRKGDRLAVRDAIASLVVRSANDAALVIGEALGGTEWNFALMMTQKGRELGMKNTVFRNPNGLPDNKQYTTAYDMARLAIALRRDFPEYYPFFKLQSFEYDGVVYPSHNRVMERYDGADGVKTGYINASGFNLVTSVRRDGYNLVGVIMGGSTASSRDSMMIDMLDRTIAQLLAQRTTDNQSASEKKSDEPHTQSNVGAVNLETENSASVLDEPVLMQGGNL